MKIISWNCRGLGNARAVRALGDLIKSHKPNILFLVETLSNEGRIKELSYKFGFDHYWAVDSNGRGGGLAIFWDRRMQCSVVQADQNHIDVHILKNNSPAWRLTGFYGFPERSRRRESWEFIKELKDRSQLPWVLIGDYNDMISEEDKSGEHKHPRFLLDGFKQTVDECGLLEIDLIGGKYTWEKSRGKKEWVRERIDRAFADTAWWQMFPLCKLEVFHTIYSDHDPIRLELCSTEHSRKKFRFRFENTWLREESFHEEVSRYWRGLGPIHFLPKLLDLSKFMEKWGRNFFNKFREKIKNQKEVLKLYEDCATESQTKKYFEEKGKLEDLLVHEEAYWKQRAKSFWLLEGDSNSKYFHAYATSRKMKSSITQLMNDDGRLISDQEGMCEVVKDYFISLFSCDGSISEERLESEEPVITEEQNEKLVADFTFDEFSQAVRQMHPDKSAGPDGLNPAFFQNFWKIMGEEVFQCCLKWLKEGSFPVNLNDTMIVLIPKKDGAECMKDLRPIALCNVLYKIIAKVLSNRLKVILPDIITDNQSAFVPGRSITDNVLIAFEMLHYMKQKKRGEEGVVALKLDVSKAYDRVDWRFLKSQMQQMGFSRQWVEWIMLCVSTVSYSVIFNNDLVGPITPHRGLRQGDPLSPYLFLLCVEGLSRAIKKSAEEGRISGCKIQVEAPAITHLLFADDSFLFCKASMDEVREVRGILQKYEMQSGQAINFQKSGIYFSSNVRVDKQMEIKNLLEVQADLSEGRYLGLPSLIGRAKKQVFNYIKDRLWKKIQGWSTKCLSKAGKAVLLRNVAQSVPSYAMSCFLLPKSLCKELEVMMNSYWWGAKEGSRKGIRWLSWSNMSMSKGAGGLGFRDLHGFNTALLGKQCWNLLSNPNSLVARVFKARYYPNSNLFEASRGGGVSFTWSGLWQAKENLKQGFRWVLGNGETIRILEDQWVRGKENYMVDFMDDESVWNRKVCELFLPGERQWDVNKVNNLFTSCDADAILAIPIPRCQVPDRITWMFTNNGIYSVKSGYRFWHDRYSEGRREQSNKGWTKLWRLEVPHKVRMLLWRIGRNNVPVRNMLRGRGVPVTIMCPMCMNDVEHMVHIFHDCRFAKECWRLMQLNFDTSAVENCSEWLVQTLSNEDNETLVRVAEVLWGIWTARNLKVWENKTMSPELALEWSIKQVSQWREVQKFKAGITNRRDQRQVVEAARWTAPEMNKYKVNVDASVVPGSRSYAVGMILRDHKGEFIKARNVRWEGEVNVFEAEARGVLEAIRWILGSGVADVVVESDSMLTVQALCKGTNILHEVGHMLQESRLLMRDRSDISVSFVKKQANKVAHLLARVPCEVNCCNEFLTPPQLVLEQILYDSMMI